MSTSDSFDDSPPDVDEITTGDPISQGNPGKPQSDFLPNTEHEQRRARDQRSAEATPEEQPPDGEGKGGS